MRTEKYKSKHIILISILSIILASCNKNEYAHNESNQLQNTSPFTITENTAIEIANNAINSISKGKTRGLTHERQISSIETINISKNHTRNCNINEPDKSVYIINYKNDKGFAIISKDKRFRSLYAISDTGHIEMSDTISNRNLAMFFNGVENDMIKTSNNEPTLQSMNGVTYILNPQVSPLIWNVPRQWGQGYPYNACCYTAEGDTAQVGCAAIACGLIMKLSCLFCRI